MPAYVMYCPEHPTWTTPYGKEWDVTFTIHMSFAEYDLHKQGKWPISCPERSIGRDTSLHWLRIKTQPIPFHQRIRDWSKD